MGGATVMGDISKVGYQGRGATATRALPAALIGIQRLSIVLL